MDGSLVIIEGSLLSRFLLLQWMLALSSWKVVCRCDFCHSNGWQPCHYGRQSIVDIFVTPKNGGLVIMEGSMSLRFLLLQWMVSLSLWKVFYFRDFCYPNGLQPCKYGRQSVVHVFVTPMNGSLTIMEGSLSLRFMLLQWIVAMSLWKLVC